MDASPSDPTPRPSPRPPRTAPRVAVLLVLLLVTAGLPAPFVEAVGEAAALPCLHPGGGPPREGFPQLGAALPPVVALADCGGREPTEAPPGDATYTRQADDRQPDDDTNLLGDPYEDLYRLRRSGFGAAAAALDPDGDGLSNLHEFRWGTIPVGATLVQDDGSRRVSLAWSNDTDEDGLEDGGERNYWNDWAEHAGEAEAAAQGYASASTSTAVRDPDSLVDRDGDACDLDDGTGYEPYGDPDTRTDHQLRFQGCSHLADDPDSDDDGLPDGVEAGPGDSIGSWIRPDSWAGAVYAWAPDSDCAHPNTTVNGTRTTCRDVGNVWNDTEPGRGYHVHRLDPGTGDGLPDPTEVRWWRDLADTNRTRWNADDGEEQDLWTYHAHRADWTTVDARLNPVEPPAVDADGDGAAGPMDRDSDDDGYPDAAEYVSTHPSYSVREAAWATTDGTAQEWRDRNLPTCDEPLLPYASDGDVDGLPDLAECGTTTHPGNGTHPLDWDTDGDGLPDGWEVATTTDPHQADAEADPDEDGLTNRQEYCYRPSEAQDRDPQRWGCTDDHDRFWTTNPCALDPGQADTDGDGTIDGTEHHDGSNAARAPDETDGTCPSATSPPQDPTRTTDPTTPTSSGNQDLDAYHPTLREAVTDGLDDTSEILVGEPLTPEEKARRAAARAEAAAEAQAQVLRDTTRNLTPVDLSASAQEAFRTLERNPSAPVPDRPIRRPADDVASAAPETRPTDDLDPLQAGALLQDAEAPEPRGLEPAETVETASSRPDAFATRTVDEATAPLTDPTYPTENRTEAAPPIPGAARDPTQDPLPDAPGVLPNLLFTLADPLRGTSQGLWSLYTEERRPAAEHTPDSTHYRLVAAGPDGATRTTPNQPLGRPLAWDVDGDATTGADGDCTSCRPPRDRGDDVVATVTPNPDGPGARLEVSRTDSSDALPWLLAAFALPPADDPRTNPGRVTYVGLDGRPADASAGNTSFDPAGTSEPAGLPAEARLRLQAPLRPDGLRCLHPRDTTTRLEARFDTVGSNRTDTEILAGAAEYTTDTTHGKRLHTDGNATNLALLLRGTPRNLSVSLQDPATGCPTQGSPEDAPTRLRWDVDRAPDAPDDGAALALDRHRRHDDESLTRTLRLGTTDLPSGSVTRRTPADDGHRAATYTYTADEEVDEAVLRTHLEAPGEDRALGIHLQGLPTSLRAQVRPDAEAYRLEASAPVDRIALVDASHPRCPGLPETPRNVLVAGTEPGASCLAARLHETRNLTLAKNPPEAPEPRFEIGLERGPEPAFVDDAFHLRTGATNWTTARLTDLPREAEVTLRRDAATDAVGLAYDASPPQPQEEVHLRSRLPDPDGPSSALRLHAQDLPHAGHATVRPQEQEIGLSLAGRASHLDVALLPDATEADPGAHHVILQDTPKGPRLQASLPNVRSIQADAGTDGRLDVATSVRTPDPLLVHVDTKGSGGPPGADVAARLSNLPDPFSLQAQATADDVHLETDASAPVDQLEIHGTVGGSHLDLDVRGLEDTALAYEEAEGRTLDVEASNPVTVQGRVVRSPDPATDRYPTLPTAPGHGVLVHEEEGGAETLAFDLESLRSTTLEYEEGTAEPHLRVETAIGDGDDPLRFHHRTERPGAEDNHLWARIDPLPSKASLQVDGRSLAYAASGPVDGVELSLDVPREGRRLEAEARAVPDSVTATWARDTPSMQMQHSGAALGHVSVAYEATEPDPGPYLLVSADDVPPSVNATADPAQGEIQLTTPYDEAATIGRLEVQYNASGSPPTLPCSTPCPDTDLLSTRLGPTGPAAAALRVHGLSRLQAALATDADAGEVTYRSTAPRPAHLDLREGEATVKGHLDPLPADGTLRYTQPHQADGALALDWDASDTVDKGALHVTSDGNTSASPATLHVRGLEPIEIQVADGTLTADSPATTDYVDLQLGAGDAYPAPRNPSSRYLLHDETPNGTRTWVRTWDLTRATADLSAHSLHLEHDPSPQGRPLEVHVDRPGFHADVEAADLPARLDLDLPHLSDPSDELRYAASAPVPAFQANATLGEPGGEEPAWELRLDARDVPTDLTLRRRPGHVALRTPDAGTIGSLHVHARNVTGARADAEAVALPEETEGLLLVKDPRFTGDGRHLPPKLHQASLQVHDLDAASASRDADRIQARLQRPSSAGGSPGLFLLADDDHHLEASTPSLPATVDPLEARFSEAPTSLHAQADPSSPFDATLKAREHGPEPLVDPPRSALDLEATDVGPGTRITATRRPADGAQPGQETVRFQADDQGTDLHAQVRTPTAAANLTLTDLPASATLTTTREAREGNLTADAPIGKLAARVHPRNASAGPALAEGQEGLLAARGPDPTLHAVVTDLEAADWRFPDPTDPDDEARVHLDHDDPQPKPVTVTAWNGTGDPTGLSADLADLPDTLDLQATRTDDALALETTTSGAVDGGLRWTKGRERLNASVDDLGPGTTTLTLSPDSPYTATLEADDPPDRLGLRALAAKTFLDASLQDLPATLEVEVDHGGSAGHVHASGPPGRRSVGSLEVYHAPCTDPEGDRTCRSPSNRVSAEHWSHRDGVLYHAEDGGRPTLLHLPDVQDLDWTTGTPDDPAWTGVRYSRPDGTPSPAIEIDLRGTPDDPAARASLLLEETPADVGAAVHTPEGADGLASPSPSPFPGVDGLVARESALALDFPADADGFRPRVAYDDGTTNLTLRNVTGLSPGTVRFDPGPPDSLAPRARLDLLDPVDGLDLRWRRTPDSGAAGPPVAFQAQAQGIPQRVTATANADDLDACPGPDCHLEAALRTPNAGSIGSVDGLLQVNASEPLATRPSGDDPYLLVTPGGDPRRTTAQASFALEDLDAVRLSAGGGRVDLGATLHDTTDLDLYYREPVDGDGSDGSEDHIAGHVRNLSGEIDATVDLDQPDGIAADARLDRDPGAPPAGFDVTGTIPFAMGPRNATSYTIEGRGIEGDVDLEARHDDGGLDVNLDTGRIRSLEADVTLEEADDEDGSGDDGDGSQGEGGFQGPLDLRYNADATGTYTGGEVEDLDVRVRTPGSTQRPDADNHVARITGEGEVGYYVKAHRLQQVTATVDPRPEAQTLVDATTRFGPVDHRREMTFLSSTGGEPKRVHSYAWPDVVEVEVEHLSPLPFESRPGEGAPLLEPTFRVKGSGGELLTVPPGYFGDDRKRRLWPLDITAVVEGQTLDASFNFEEGEEFVYGIDEATPTVLKAALQGGAQKAVEFSIDTAQGHPGSGGFHWKGRVKGPVVIEYDLDGVQSAGWSDEVVAYLDIPGSSELRHDFDEGVLSFEAPDPESRADDVALWLENATDSSGSEATPWARISGTPRYQTPDVELTVDDTDFDVPNCLWGGECR